jgi:hypothetical protein
VLLWTRLWIWGYLSCLRGVFGLFDIVLRILFMPDIEIFGHKESVQVKAVKYRIWM